MRNRVNHIKTLIGMLTVALFAAALPVSAQTISNTARAEWDAGVNRVSLPSNRVDLVVETAAPGTPTLTTYQLTPSGQPGQPIVVPQTFCQTPNGQVPSVLGGVFAGTSLSPANLTPSNRIRAGEPLVVELLANQYNTNSAQIETVSVRLTTPSGDAEVITLTESGANTGVFRGLINTIPAPPPATPGDCRLTVVPGETLTL